MTAKNIKPLKGYSEKVQDLLARGDVFEAYDFTVQYFRTRHMSYAQAKRFIPESVKKPNFTDYIDLKVLIDATPGTRFHSLPDSEQQWDIDEAYPPLEDVLMMSESETEAQT